MHKVLFTLLLASALCIAQDPTKVAAGQYKLIAENDDVRVLEVNAAPGSKTAMHSHPALMAVMLRPSITKWTMKGGKTEESAPAKRGSVAVLPPQTHISENIGKQPLRAILIEFTKPAPAAANARKASMMRGCKVVAESDNATAQLCSGAVGTTIPKHTHAGTVVYVALTDINAEITDGDGKTHTLEMKKDSAALAPPETHSAKNIGTAGYALLVVDLK